MTELSHTRSHAHTLLPSDPALRVKAIESLLVEKGLVDPSAIDAVIDSFENKIGPRNGAMVVARSWTDPDYRTRLLDDASAAIAELGFQHLATAFTFVKPLASICRHLFRPRVLAFGAGDDRSQFGHVFPFL